MRKRLTSILSCLIKSHGVPAKKSTSGTWYSLEDFPTISEQSAHPSRAAGFGFNNPVIRLLMCSLVFSGNSSESCEWHRKKRAI